MYLFTNKLAKVKVKVSSKTASSLKWIVCCAAKIVFILLTISTQSAMSICFSNQHAVVNTCSCNQLLLRDQHTSFFLLTFLEHITSNMKFSFKSLNPTKKKWIHLFLYVSTFNGIYIIDYLPVQLYVGCMIRTVYDSEREYQYEYV